MLDPAGPVARALATLALSVPSPSCCRLVLTWPPLCPHAQMFFRATLFSAFGASKRWLATNPDGSTRTLSTADYYKAVRLPSLAPALGACSCPVA